MTAGCCWYISDDNSLRSCIFKPASDRLPVLGDHPLDRIKPDLELFHLRSKADTAVVLEAGKYTAALGIYIKKDARNRYYFLLQAFSEEGHSIVKRFR